MVEPDGKILVGGFFTNIGGKAYVLCVGSGRYTLTNATRVITLTDDLEGDDFIADGSPTNLSFSPRLDYRTPIGKPNHAAKK